MALSQEDLVQAFNYVMANMPTVDTTDLAAITPDASTSLPVVKNNQVKRVDLGMVMSTIEDAVDRAEAAVDYVDNLTVDTEPTEDSEHLVSSAAVYDAVADVAGSVSDLAGQMPIESIVSSAADL